VSWQTGVPTPQGTRRGQVFMAEEVRGRGGDKKIFDQRGNFSPAKKNAALGCSKVARYGLFEIKEVTSTSRG